MNTDTQSISNVEAALAAGKAIAAKPIVAESTEAVLVVPQGYKVEAIEKVIEPYLPAPRRIKGTVQMATLESFAAYVNQFKRDETVIFANIPSHNGPPSLTAVIDYHNSEGAIAGWCQHVAVYAPGFTEEWKRWTEKDKVKFTQSSFAEFLEENQTLVVDPPGAELLEFVQTLEGHNNITCNSLIRLANGKQKLIYEEDVELKGQFSNGEAYFPSRLVAAIQLFDGGTAYKVTCRLKYRLPNRKLEIWFECVDLHLIIKDAVQDIVSDVEEKTGIIPYNGKV